MRQRCRVLRWLGEAKVLCILCHWGVQLILAYSWPRSAILAAGKDRRGMFLFLLFFHFHSFFMFLPCPSLSSSLLSLLSLFSIPLGNNTKYSTRVDMLNPNTISLLWVYTVSSDLHCLLRLGKYSKCELAVCMNSRCNHASLAIFFLELVMR